MLVASVAAGLQGQQDPMDLLRKVQAKVSDSINRLPRYMCTETVDRSFYQADGGPAGVSCDDGVKRRMHLSSSDRLRLDVGMAAAVEMYSWVGESRFDDRDLFEMVNEGAISSGAFAAFLTAIFRTEDADFTYNGESSHNGRTLAEYGFHVPYEKSHYTFGQGIHRVTTAWQGTFFVDPKTADLVRLEVSTSQLPPETGACYATTKLDYENVRMKGIDFLLPSISVLTILHSHGGEAINHTVFSNCHEFLGESKISYDAPPDAAGTDGHSASGAGLAIPAGIPFQVAFTEGFYTGTAAAGDPVKARLLTAIQSGRKVLVPAGAAVTGRIVRLRRFYGDSPALSLEVKLETVEIAGAPMKLTAVPDIGVRIPAKKTDKKLQQRIELGTLRGLQERSAAFVFRNVPDPYLIRGGMESSWITASGDHRP